MIELILLTLAAAGMADAEIQQRRELKFGKKRRKERGLEVFEQLSTPAYKLYSQIIRTDSEPAMLQLIESADSWLLAEISANPSARLMLERHTYKHEPPKPKKAKPALPLSPDFTEAKERWFASASESARRALEELNHTNGIRNFEAIESSLSRGIRHEIGRNIFAAWVVRKKRRGLEKEAKGLRRKSEEERERQRMRLSRIPRGSIHGAGGD